MGHVKVWSRVCIIPCLTPKVSTTPGGCSSKAPRTKAAPGAVRKAVPSLSEVSGGAVEHLGESGVLETRATSQRFKNMNKPMLAGSCLIFQAKACEAFEQWNIQDACLSAGGKINVIVG